MRICAYVVDSQSKGTSAVNKGFSCCVIRKRHWSH